MSNFKFQGKITSIGSVRSGQTKAGKDWSSIDFVVTEEKDQYPNSGSFSLFKMGDYKKFAEEFPSNYSVGDTVTIEFDLKADSFTTKNGDTRFMNKLNAFKVDKISATETNTPAYQEENDIDDLPF